MTCPFFAVSMSGSLKRKRGRAPGTIRQTIAVPTASDYEYGRYQVCSDLKSLKETLNTYGVAIVPNVLTAKEIQEFRDGFWSYLEHATQKLEFPICRNEESSWSSLASLSPLHGMILNYYGIGHAQFMWNLRQNFSVIRTFQAIYGTENPLVSSFEGANIHLRSSFYDGHPWFHTDCTGNVEFQSWLTAYDVRVGDATIAIIEGSHMYFDEFAARYPMPDSKGWPTLTVEQLHFFTVEKGLPIRYIACPAGSMCLWDSRTIHSVVKPMEWRLRCNIFMAANICMTSDTRALHRLAKYAKKMKTTTSSTISPRAIPDVPRYRRKQSGLINKVPQ